MKTLLLSLGLCAGRRFRFLAAPVALSAILTGAAHAQVGETPKYIVFPQNGQDVRGEISVRLEGIPGGGYAIVKLDDQFKLATARNSFALDTLADPSFLAKTDGQYTLEVVVMSATGGRLGTHKINFNVANKKIVENGESVRLSHWIPTDVLRDDVVRYRIFAESNATIEEGGATGGAGGGSAGGGTGGGDTGESYIAAPLDWQVAALLRRTLRNLGGFDNSANIATVFQEAHQRQRESESSAAGAEGGAGGGGATKKKKKGGSSAPTKAPWTPEWMLGPETGQHFIKTIQQTGDQINATRKSISVSLADLLPTFPTVPVVPGSTWSSKMSILGDLSSRESINIEGPITFTNYENILTSAGQNRRCAKLESRFRLPDSVSKRIAANLANQVGTTAGAAGGESGGGGSTGGESATGAGRGGGGGGGRGGAAMAAPAAGGGDAGAEKILPEDIEVAQVNVARVIWFDMDRRQIVRAEDTMRSYFEMPETEGAGGGATGGGSGRGGGGGRGAAMGGGEDGAEAEPAEPTKVSYNLNVTTWLDDKVPPVNYQYTGGAGTAHGRDSVTEPGLARATRAR